MKYIYLVIAGIVVLAGGFLILFAFDLDEEVSRPNIVVIVVDDLDLKTLQVTLENDWMPNLKKYMINNGTTFDNSFVTNSVCCPSQATLLTGLYSHNHNVLTNNPNRNGSIVAFDDTSTLSVWLQNAGYRTGHVGKYMIGYGVSTEPNYIPPGFDDWQALVDPDTYQVFNYTINDNGSLMRYGEEKTDYQTDVLAKRATDFIYESVSIQPSSPFFLKVMTMAIHAEKFTDQNCNFSYMDIGLIRSPPRYEDTAKGFDLPKNPSFNEINIKDKPAWLEEFPPLDEQQEQCLTKFFQKRVESLRAVDDLIGQIANALNDTEQLKKTVLIFTSDNGFLLGDHRIVGKNVFYEESIRVPLIILLPDYPSEQTINQLVTNNDLAPTIVDLSNISPPMKMDGVSLVPLILNSEDIEWRNKILLEHFSVGWRPNHFAVREDSTIFIKYEDSVEEFYDLKTDPYQLQSLHDCDDEFCKKILEKHRIDLEEIKNCGNGACQIIERRK